MRYIKLFTTYWICLSQTFLVAPLVVLTSQILRQPSFHYLDCERYRVKTSHVTCVEQLLICSLIPRLSPPPKSLGMRLLPVHFDDERLWFLPYSLFRQWTQELAILHDLAVCKVTQEQRRLICSFPPSSSWLDYKPLVTTQLLIRKMSGTKMFAKKTWHEVMSTVSMSSVTEMEIALTNSSLLKCSQCIWVMKSSLIPRLLPCRKTG